MSIVAARLRPIPTGLALGGGGFVLVLGGAAGLLTSSLLPLQVGAALVALAGVAYLSVWTMPALFTSLAIAASVFSGHSDELGLPIGLDRVLLAAALLSLALGLPGAVRTRVLVWRPLHLYLGLAAAMATVSAIAAGTLFTQSGGFALLDRYGLVPFLVFTLAPLIFATERQRNVLLVVLVALGAYLSLTALFEATGLRSFVWPGYINDPTVGIHFGRARGPFAEGAGNGLGLFGCAVGAAVAAFTWRTTKSRVIAGIVVLSCLGGTMFTLTRAVWLATILATGVALLASPRTRVVLGPLVIVGLVGLLSALAFVPEFSEQAEDRSGSERPLWDRYNTNRAALSMVRSEPLFGVGWDRFTDESDEYLWLADGYPLTGENLDVHNVPLSHAAELGVPTTLVWLTALLLAVVGGVLRSGPPFLDPWRLATLALFVHWLVVASFGPLGYAFPNLLLWTFAGIAGMAHTSAPVDASGDTGDERALTTEADPQAPGGRGVEEPQGVTDSRVSPMVSGP